MENKKDKPYLLYTIIGVLVLVLFFQQWKLGMNEDSLINSVAEYKDSVYFYKTKTGTLVSTNRSLVLNAEKQLIAMAKLSKDVQEIVKKYKDLKSVTYITNTFLAGGDTSKYKTPIPCDFKPFNVRHKDSAYTFKGTVAKDFFSVDSLIVPNKITLVAGRKKEGFMKSAYSMDVINSNPLMKTTNIADYRYIPEKKLYERTWVHWIEGALIQSGIQYGVKQAIKYANP